MIKHAVSTSNIEDIAELHKLAVAVDNVKKKTKINPPSSSSSSGDSIDTTSDTPETSTVVSANCTCFCTIKDAIFKLFRCR